jgi:5-oxoprolinase (ATP-hydrolysing)
VCYRKNGYLAVTDANVVLGRVIPEFFPNIFGPNEDEPLDLEGARAAFRALAEENHEADGRTVEELAYGFVQVCFSMIERHYSFLIPNQPVHNYSVQRLPTRQCVGLFAT